MLSRLIVVAAFAVLSASTLARAADPVPAGASSDAGRYFEMRKYYAMPGKLADLNATLRGAQGRFADVGPAVVWIRVCGRVVDDDPPSGVQRAMAAADFGNGVSRELPFGGAGGYLFINPDLTVYLHRPPVGDWICLDARTHLSGVGTGVAESALSDGQGRIGRSVQALLVDRLP